MTTHVIIRGAEWVLSDGRAEDAPDAVYVAACLTCSERSGQVDDDRKPVGMWALNHTQQHGLSHSQFRLTTERHWRVDLMRAPAPAAGPPRTRAHARPRRRRSGAAIRRAVAQAGRLAGSLVLAALVVGAVISGLVAGRAMGRGPC